MFMCVQNSHWCFSLGLCPSLRSAHEQRDIPAQPSGMDPWNSYQTLRRSVANMPKGHLSDLRDTPQNVESVKEGPLECLMARRSCAGSRRKGCNGVSSAPLSLRRQNTTSQLPVESEVETFLGETSSPLGSLQVSEGVRNF